MVSDRQIRLAGAGLAIGFGLAIVLLIVSVTMQMTALLFSDTFVGNAPGSDWLNEVVLILGDYAELIQSLVLTRIFSIILIIFGIVMLERALRDGETGGWLRGLGALSSVIAAVLLIAGLGLELAGVHTLAIGEAEGSAAEMELAKSHAETLTLAASGMGLMTAPILLFGSAALHFGLSSRHMFRHSSRISMIVGVVSVFTLLLLVFSNYLSSVVVQTYIIANILGFVPRLWLLFIGIMMYRKGDAILDS